MEVVSIVTFTLPDSDIDGIEVRVLEVELAAPILDIAEENVAVKLK